MKKSKEAVEIEVKMLSKTAKLPTRGTSSSAGYDLYADIEEDIEIRPHTTVKINTGIAVAIPEGYFGGIFPRSGLATKQGLNLANCVGVVDSDYRAGIIVALHNNSDETQTVMKGTRIAQLIVIPYLPLDFTIVDELEETYRGEGGFGSTGLK